MKATPIQRLEAVSEQMRQVQRNLRDATRYFDVAAVNRRVRERMERVTR